MYRQPTDNMATQSLIALSITKSKNPSIFMVNTAKGAFTVRKPYLDKRGIIVQDIYKFPEPTVVIVETHKGDVKDEKGNIITKGDYIFGYDANGKPAQAPTDSSVLNENGEPRYLKGSTPTWESDGSTVRSFVSFQEFKAQLELEKLMATA